MRRLAAPRATVAYERLLLQGFARHRSVTISFPAGLGVWAAANERGKTTALLGLAGTLWGVAHRSDPAQPGWGRYRSWQGGPHRGTLTLRAADGARYRVERDFETHRVRVARLDPGGDTLLIDTTHNPAARLAASPYEVWLREALGVSDGALVLATAVLAQGDVAGEPHRVGSDVQRLVSGAGAGGAHAALERLAEALRERTRSLRALGVGAADLRQPRRLEQLEAQQVELERRIEAGREAADGRQRAQRAVAAAEATLEAAEAARAVAEAREQAARAWLSQRGDAERSSERLRLQRSDAERAREATRALEQAERTLERLHRRAVPSADADAELRAAEAAAAGLERARGRVDEAVAALSAHRRSAPSTGPSSGPSGGPNAVPASPAGDEAATPLVSAGEPLEALASPVADQVRRARRVAHSLARRLEAARTLSERLRSDEDELASLAAAFASLDAGALALVSGFGQRERVLVERVQAARSRRDDLLERVERHRAAFAEVRLLTPQQVTALEAFDEALERRRDPRPWRVGAAALGALIGGVAAPTVLGLLELTFAPAGLVGAAAGALIGALIPIGDGTARARAELAEHAVSGDDDELRQRLRRRAAYDAQYDQVQADARALEEAQAQLAELEAEGRAFLEVAEPILRALPEDADVDEAYQRWLRLTPLVASARAELAALLVDVLDLDAEGADPAGFEQVGAAALAEPVVSLIAFARVVGLAQADEPTLGDLATWLDRLDDDAWANWEARALALDTRRAEERTRAERAQAERERHEAWGAALEAAAAAAAREHDAALEAWTQAVTALRRWWSDTSLDASAPLEPATPPGHGRGAAAQGAAAPVDPSAPDADDLLIDDDEVVAVEPRIGAAPTPSADVGAHLGAIRAHLDQVRAAEAARDGAERSLAALVERSGVADATDLIGRTAPLERALEAHMSVWRDLVERHPWLPAARLDGADAAAASTPLEEGERHLAQAREREREAREHEREARAALLAAQRELAASEGREVENVAVLLEERGALAAQIAGLRDEIAALALAHQELAASVQGYVDEHRSWLEQRAGAIIATISGRPGRRVRLDDGFALSVIEPSGDVALPEQLSQGTRDQVALALRLAVLDRIAHDVPLPLVLDDPFLHWDEGRVHQVRLMLEALARERQVLLLTHRRDLAAWGAEIEVVDGPA